MEHESIEAWPLGKYVFIQHMNYYMLELFDQFI